MKKKLSVLKRQRQNEKRRLRNYIRKRKIKTLAKKLYRLINKSSKDQKPQEESINTLIKEVEELRNDLFQAIDKAAKSGVLHRNTAARKKSKAARKVAEFIRSCLN